MWLHAEVTCENTEHFINLQLKCKMKLNYVEVINMHTTITAVRTARKNIMHGV